VEKATDLGIGLLFGDICYYSKMRSVSSMFPLHLPSDAALNFPESFPSCPTNDNVASVGRHTSPLVPAPSLLRATAL
jgi:hypothetical protein